MSASHHQKEFRAFQSGDASVPQNAISGVLATVHRDLNPSPYKVFAKLLGIHAAVSVFTMAICPQFGVRTFGVDLDIVHYFMSLGEHACQFACGTIFTGASLFVAGFLLRGEELRAIRQNRWLGIGAVTLLSLGFFFMADGFLGASAMVGASFTFAWVAGTFLGGVGILELAWRYRFK